MTALMKLNAMRIVAVAGIFDLRDEYETSDESCVAFVSQGNESSGGRGELS